MKVAYLNELNPSDKVEYLYYSDLVNYIVERYKNESSTKLLKKCRVYFENIRNGKNVNDNIAHIKNELSIYCIEYNTVVNSIEYKSSEQYKIWISNPLNYKGFYSTIDLIDLI